MNDQISKPKIIKVLLIGHQQTGKTSLFVRYCKSIYINNPLIDLYFFTKDFKIINYLNNLNVADYFLQEEQEVKFSFCDFHSFGLNYLIISSQHGSSILMLLYDITNIQSFKKVMAYYRDHCLMCGNNFTTIFLVSNKCDLEEERQVSYQEGKQLSESLGMIFMEVSAKEDYKVNELFEKLMHYAFNFN